MNKTNTKKLITNYREQKRLQELAGVKSDNNDQIRPEFKQKVDQLVNNLKHTMDELRRLRRFF